MSKNNMGDNSGNIAIGGILTECNEFSINLMTKENFERYEYYEGNEILNLKSGVVGGMLNALNGSSFNVSPTVFASCSPGGIIEEADRPRGRRLGFAKLRNEEVSRFCQVMACEGRLTFQFRET